MTGPDSRGEIARSIELTRANDWQRAAAVLASLDLHELGAEHLSGDARHELGNALAIARAGLQGIADRVLPPTPERIEGILASLQSSARVLDDL